VQGKGKVSEIGATEAGAAFPRFSGTAPTDSFSQMDQVITININ
jgi:hypothetical protein